MHKRASDLTSKLKPAPTPSSRRSFQPFRFSPRRPSCPTRARGSRGSRGVPRLSPYGRARQPLASPSPPPPPPSQWLSSHHPSRGLGPRGRASKVFSSPMASNHRRCLRSFSYRSRLYNFDFTRFSRGSKTKDSHPRKSSGAGQDRGGNKFPPSE